MTKVASKQPTRLWVDQYGSKYWARTVKELRAQIGMGAQPPACIFRWFALGELCVGFRFS